MQIRDKFIVLLLLFILVSCSKASNDEVIDVFGNSLTKSHDEEVKVSNRLAKRAEKAKKFSAENGLNTDYAVLIDMSIHSGKHRMFVYNLDEKRIEHSSLCAHGIGKDDQKSTQTEPKFSNKEGSLLSSLGKYRIGKRAYSQWGINVHYKLHGLEATNNNAYKRIVVLHSHTPVTEDEIYPSHLPLGWSFGCPVTDDETMKYLDVKFQNSQKPVLLWIFNGDE